MWLKFLNYNRIYTISQAFAFTGQNVTEVVSFLRKKMLSSVKVVLTGIARLLELALSGFCAMLIV